MSVPEPPGATALDHLPSPSSSHSLRPPKRRQSCASEPCDSRITTTKRARHSYTESRILFKINDAHSKRIAFWIEQQKWPPAEPAEVMSSQKRQASQSSSSLSHWSQRWQKLAECGISHEEPASMSSKNEKLYKRMEEERFQEVTYSSVPADQLALVSSRAQLRNETRIQRDITPWVLPSAELLHYNGVKGLAHLSEELNVEWRCSTMGWKHPKPDVTVGLLHTAFTDQEWQRLNAHATPGGPVCVTPHLSFPFLVCEAKSGRVGLDEGDGQNLHSAAIAVRAIFQLYDRAWGWRSPRMKEDLDGQVLVFTISHDADRVHICGHFAVIEQATSVSELHYHRHSFLLLSLKVGAGSQRLSSYNFVRNLYDRFAPEHVKRLRDAIKMLHVPQVLSRAPSQVLEGSEMDDNAGDNSSEVDRGRTPVRQPVSVASVTTPKVISQLMEQLAQQREDSERQLAQLREHSEKQLAQQREDSEKLLAQLRADSEKQRADSEKQRVDSEKQLQRMTDLIERLLNPAK